MTDKKSNPLWNILKSVRLTLILLSILAVASIIGTVIQEQGEAGIYHSTWFRFIIFCLAVNLIVCSIDRFPGTLKLFRFFPRADRSKVFEEAGTRRTSFANVSIEQASSRIEESLRGSFNKLVIKDSANASYIYCEKGRFSLFSVYLVHLSVLFILIGAIIGSMLGFNAYVNILEGGATDTIVITRGGDHRYQELGFTVRCERFLIDYYDNGMPKEYRSDLSFIVNGKEVLKKNLLVNHPIKFMGITFYQSGYGSVPGEKVRIRFINDEKGVEETTILAELKKSIVLPDKRGELILSDIRENFMNLGPAALISIKSPDGQETSIWLFKNRDMIMENFSEMFELSPKFNASSFSPFTFYFDDMEYLSYTGLQVARDPGVGLVFIGFIMIIIGLFFTFFTSHRKFWIRIALEKGDLEISLAGMANKNPVGMERELDRLFSRLKKVTMEGNHNG